MLYFGFDAVQLLLFIVPQVVVLHFKTNKIFLFSKWIDIIRHFEFLEMYHI